MKHTQEEILNALQVIKDTCAEVGEHKDGCYSCPFYVNRECIIANTEPEDWELNSKVPIWRAFK